MSDQEIQGSSPGSSELMGQGIQILCTSSRDHSVLMSSQSSSVGRIKSRVVGVRVDKKGGVMNPSFELISLRDLLSCDTERGFSKINPLTTSNIVNPDVMT